MKKYWIATFGCQMNMADSERIAANLEKNSYTPAKNAEKSDLVVVNMCSIRQPAVDRVFGLIAKIKRLKKKPKTILTGCILKKDKEKFKKEFDKIVPKEKFLKCPMTFKGKKRVFVPISNGCNNFCSYCVVPYVRGSLKCRNHKEILREIKKAAENGAKEIWLLGQNVNDYKSPTDSKINFAKLFKLADNIQGNFKLRFMSPHPKNFSDELIEVLAKSSKFSRYINLPLQSGDDTILKKMNRPYTLKKYKTLVKKIRAKMPDINLSTDIIVGFPGETKEQFQNTVKAFKKIGFNIAYINKYSKRKGTEAFNFEDNISLEEKKDREKILLDLIKHE